MGARRTHFGSEAHGSTATSTGTSQAAATATMNSGTRVFGATPISVNASAVVAP
jgi:hypothetical protein